MKTIYLVYQTEGDYESYQEEVLRVFLSEAKADNYRAELAAKLEAKNAAAEAVNSDVREWMRHNPRPPYPVGANALRPDPALREWHESYDQARRALNPDNLYKSDLEYKVQEAELDDEE